MAKGKYTRLIDEYCKEQGFEVPVGFFRRPASPLAVVMMDSSPPKLVATTWFTREDVVYYIKHLVLANSESHTAPVRIFDFAKRKELEYTGGKRLKTKCELHTNP